ncbi:MAG: transporter [Deltaproteobacteria bacterium]|nr:transporter [Deltaproteobacteria bacterium]
MRRPSLAALASFAAIALYGAPAQAGPITFNTALPVHGGEVILREQVIWRRATGGPGPESADENVLAVPTVIVWGIHTRVALISQIPFLYKDVQLSLPSGARAHRTTTGFGDLSTVLRVSALQLDGPGRTLRLAPFAGLKLPTGAQNESDELGRLPPRLQLGTGSWDPIFGLIATWQTLDFELDASLSYNLRTAANDFDAGDEVRADLSFQYRIFPFGDLEGGVPGFVYLVLESRVLWQAEDRGAVAPTPSGGWSWALAPGLQYVTMRYVIEGAVELPVTQPDGLHDDFTARLSFRASF